MPKVLTYKHIIRIISVFTAFFVSSFSFLNAQNENADVEKQVQDTILAVDIFAGDTVNVSGKDSIDGRKVNKKNDEIKSEIVYSARDSIVFYGSGVAFLYGNAQVNYEKMELISDNIRINMDSSVVQARGRIDSAGVLVETPIFKDGTDQYESKSIDYNFKTQRGFIRGVITQQGDGFITSDKAKKLEDNIFLMVDGKYTTCDEHDHPHFYLNLTKAKVKPNQFVVAGPAYLVIADVPLPLVLPFGYFPFTEKYSSGILMPSYGEESSRGFFLRNGGYYFALSDYYDLAVRGDIYTKGSWGLNATTRYRKRYKYTGNFYASYMVTINGEETLPDYSRNNDMKILWTHTQDPKANPFRTFSASVNFSSVKYNKNNVDSRFSPSLYGENNTSSSINYTYRFPESPFSVTLNMTANQRQSDSTLSLTLPTLRLDMSRIFPFKSAGRVGKERWFEKIYLTYNLDFTNRITTKQDKLFDAHIIKDWNNGMQHRLSLGSSYNLLKYLTVSPGMNYSEKWYLKKIEREWTDDAEKLSTVNSFYRISNFDAKIDFSTQLFGFFKPVPALFGTKVDMIRHVFQPTIGISCSPDFGGYFGSYYRPVPYTSDSTKITYGYFEGSPFVFGGPSHGKRLNVNFSISNNLEMKVTSKKDTTGFRKISLIDNLSANVNYNALADSLNWSDISASMRIKLSKNISVSINANFTPYIYQLDQFQNPVKVNTTELEKNGRLARMTRVGTSFGYSFSNDMFKKKQTAKEKKETESKSKQSEFDEKGYLLFKMPWNFRFDYSINYADHHFDKERLEHVKKTNQSLNFSGNITFSKSWQFNFSSGYDFDAKKISYSSCGISRDLHCWTASLNLVPFGVNRSYNFLIHVKSSLLQDLKYEQQSDPSSSPAWY